MSLSKNSAHVAAFLLYRFIYQGKLWLLRDRARAASGWRHTFLESCYYRKLDDKCSWIGLNAHFEGEPTFPHGPVGVFVSNAARIGSRCVIFQFVLIGSNTLEDSRGRGAPIIADGCYIGAGATIVGNISIGRNCRIGANAIVTQSIGDNCVVVSQPSRVIARAEMDNKFREIYDA